MAISDNHNFNYSIESDALLFSHRQDISVLTKSITNLDNSNVDLLKKIDIKEKNYEILNKKLKDQNQTLQNYKKLPSSNKLEFNSIRTAIKSIILILWVQFVQLYCQTYVKIARYRYSHNKGTVHNKKTRIEVLEKNISFILSQKAQGLELYKEQWLTIEEIELRKEAEIGISNNFSDFNPFDFELFIAELLKEMGYHIIEVTRKTGDYGVDIIAEKNNKKVAIQCKRFQETNLVTNKSVAQLLGSMSYYKADQCIFVTTSYYTKNALQQIKNAPIELWDKDTLHSYVKKYLLHKDASEIFDAIENARNKEKIKNQQAALKIQEKREISKEKSICPICGGGKLKSRKICSRCKQDRRKRDRGGKGGYDRGFPDGSDLPGGSWDAFSDGFGRW